MDRMHWIKNLFDNIAIVNFWDSAYVDASMRIVGWRNVEALVGKAAA